MKTRSLIFKLLAFVMLLAGCSKDNPTSTNFTSSENNTPGNISLKIDKNTVPNNVSEVIAYLSRADYDTLTGQLNLTTDTSADISFPNIAAGVWHLRINALSSEGLVMYSGETDVQVNAGTFTDVNLTLMPAGNGTGSVYIHVNWGTGQSSFVDYNMNPIFTIYNNPSFPNLVSMSKVINDNGIYKMWYVCTYNAGKGNVWYAESKDGINWKNLFNNPVFQNDSDGTWDDYTVQCGAVLKKDNLYLMYYNGWQSQYGQWQIGLAVSNDGYSWERYNDPILKADSSANYKLGVISVLNVNGLYYMYYTSTGIGYNSNTSVNLATSVDGIKWIRYSGNPVIRPTENWEGASIFYPAVIYDNRQFIMVYSSNDRTKFGIAYSQDGKNWSKSSTPTFTVNDSNLKPEQINYPFLMKIGNEYKLYYTATVNNIISLCYAYNLNLK